MNLQHSFKDFSNNSRDKFADIILFIKNLFINEVAIANMEERSVPGGVKIIFYKKNYYSKYVSRVSISIYMTGDIVTVFYRWNRKVGVGLELKNITSFEDQGFGIEDWLIGQAKEARIYLEKY